MRLTNDIKEGLLIRLTEKAFPKEGRDVLISAVSKAVEETERYRTAVKALREYPDFTERATSVDTKLKLETGAGGFRIEIPVGDYAMGIFRYYRSSFRICSESPEDKGNLYLEQGVREAYHRLWDYVKKQNDFVKDLHGLLEACSSTAKLTELVPEAKEFLPNDNKMTALVPKEQIDRVNRALGGGNE